MSKIEDKAEGFLFGLLIMAVVVIVIIAVLVYIAAWAALIALVLGIVWGVVKYMICAYSMRHVIRNIWQRGGPGAAAALVKAHYSVVEDADLQMDIWLNRGIGDYVAPGDDVKPSTSYGFVRFASWPFFIRWIPCIAYLVFTAFLRVGFLLCFCFSLLKLGIATLVRKFTGKKGGKAS